MSDAPNMWIIMSKRNGRIYVTWDVYGMLDQPDDAFTVVYCKMGVALLGESGHVGLFDTSV